MKRPAFYRTFEHTADLGIEVDAATEAELYANAASAMFTEMLGAPPPRGDRELVVRVEGRDREDLMVRWLNELLYLAESRGVIFGHCRDLELEEAGLRAVCLGIGLEEAALEIATEIKAATYHQIEVSRTDRGFRARIVFDL